MNNKEKWFFGSLLVVIMAFVAFVLPATADENVQKHEQTKEGKLIAATIVHLLEQYHYSKPKIDDTVSHLLFDEYIKKLDANKLYFLDADIQEFSQYRESLDDLLKNGDVDFAFVVYKRFLQRVQERIYYIEQRLTKPFDFSSEEKFMIKRDEAPWTKSPNELDEEWRKYLKNQLLQSKLQEMKQLEIATTEVENVVESNTKSENVIESDTKVEESDTKVENTENVVESDTKVEESDTWKETPEQRIINRYKSFYNFMKGNDNYYVLELYLTSLTNLFDPHSSYLNWRTLDNFNIALRLSLQGIGAVISSDNGYPKIASVVPGGPADKQGELKAGYMIISVTQESGETESVIDMPLNQVVQKIRGEKGTKVTITCIKNVQDVPFNITIVRDEVKLTEQEAKGVTRDITLNGKSSKVGVITLPSFYSDFEAKNNDDPNAKSTTVDVKKILESMKKENVEGLIIDLRSNGGGSLDEVVNLAGLFIPSGPMVQVKDLSGEIEVRKDDDDGFAYDMPLVVLVNTFSASASEIFAATIQDYKRGVIVGGNTYGKGTVQNLLGLQRMPSLAKIKAGALKFTIAKFYRVTGASTQKKGVASDITYPSLIDINKYGEASLPYVMEWDTIPPLDLEYSKQQVQKFLPSLLEKHNDRIKDHPKFQNLQKYIEYIQKREEQKYVSLHLDTRKKMQEEETRWYEEVNKILGENTDNADTTKEKDDLYLEESLVILRDLITANSDTVEEATTVEEVEKPEETGSIEKPEELEKSSK